MLTFFQIMSMDGWCSTVVRPLVCSGHNCEHTDLWTALFFMSYLLINGVMMVNVVVAILLDKFITEMTNLREEEQAEKDAAQAALSEELDAQERAASSAMEGRFMTVC